MQNPYLRNYTLSKSKSNIFKEFKYNTGSSSLWVRQNLRSMQKLYSSMLSRKGVFCIILQLVHQLSKDTVLSDSI